MNSIRDWLIIGKFRDTRSLDRLRVHGITAMLQLAGESVQPGIASKFVYVEDAESLPHDKLMAGVHFIREQHAHKRRILVACAAGISRSAAFCVAALKEIEELDLDTAYVEVHRAHPGAQPHPKLWISLCEYYNGAVQSESDTLLHLMDLRKRSAE